MQIQYQNYLNAHLLKDLSALVIKYLGFQNFVDMNYIDVSESATHLTSEAKRALLTGQDVTEKTVRKLYTTNSEWAILCMHYSLEMCFNNTFVVRIQSKNKHKNKLGDILFGLLGPHTDSYIFVIYRGGDLRNSMGTCERTTWERTYDSTILKDLKNILQSTTDILLQLYCTERNMLELTVNNQYLGILFDCSHLSMAEFRLWRPYIIAPNCNIEIL